MVLKASALFFLVNTQRQNSFFLLDEDGKRLKREDRSFFHVLLNESETKIWFRFRLVYI